MTDGSLRQIFSKKMPEAMWTSIESFSTGRGIPDVEYCFPGGQAGWIELKLTRGWAVGMRPEQVAWLERRSRLGGRSFIAIRQLGKARDGLWLCHGQDARLLMTEGLRGAEKAAVGHWGGGPAGWDWAMVRAALTASY